MSGAAKKACTEIATEMEAYAERERGRIMIERGDTPLIAAGNSFCRAREGGEISSSPYARTRAHRGKEEDRRGRRGREGRRRRLSDATQGREGEITLLSFFSFFFLFL